MSFSVHTLFIALLAGICSAQQAPNSFREHIANLVLAERSAIDSNIECGRYYDDVVPNAIGLRIFSNYTPDTCYNLATIFDPEKYENDAPVDINDNGLISDSCDPFYRNCTRDFQANGIDNHNSSANYSQIQIDFYNDDIRRPSDDLELRVFAGNDCQEDGKEPWFSWGGCDEDGLVNYCRELPYSVGSFRLQMAAGGSDRECKVAAERGAGTRGRHASLAMGLAGVVIALFIGSI